MKHLWTVIGVADVPRSFTWYQSLLGLPAAPPAHDYFGTLETGGAVLLCLHRWGDHEHSSLANAGRAQPGNGLLLFFRVDDFDQTLPRARALVTELEEEPHINSNAGTREFALRDPDGCYGTVSSLSTS